MVFENFLVNTSFRVLLTYQQLVLPFRRCFQKIKIYSTTDSYRNYLFTQIKFKLLPWGFGEEPNQGSNECLQEEEDNFVFFNDLFNIIMNDDKEVDVKMDEGSDDEMPDPKMDEDK